MKWALVFLLFSNNSHDGFLPQVAVFDSERECKARAAEIIKERPEGYPHPVAAGCIKIIPGGARNI